MRHMGTSNIRRRVARSGCTSVHTREVPANRVNLLARRRRRDRRAQRTIRLGCPLARQCDEARRHLLE